MPRSPRAISGVLLPSTLGVLVGLFATLAHQAMADEPPIVPSSPGTTERPTLPTNSGEITVLKPGSGRKSSFLSPPGADRYDQTDWREIPPWRQASFFGLRVKGQFFVYVVDCSGSMIDEQRLERAKDELRRSVSALREPQRFYVVFYNDRPIPMPGGMPRSVGYNERVQFLRWLRLIEPDGETDPRSAIAQALAMRPDGVFLLSDGAFPDGTVEAVAKGNPGKTPIHCIDLSGGLGGDQLSRIARESGGRYLARP